MKVSVFTVMLGAEYGLQGAADVLAEFGFDGVEWRVHDEFHVPVEGIEGRTQEVARISAERGLAIAGFATYLPPASPHVPAVFRAAAEVGAPQARVTMPAYDRSEDYHSLFRRTRKALEDLEPLLRSTGVKAAVEIHMGTLTPSAGLAKRLVDGLDPALYGVIFDPGNMAVEGFENYRLGLELLGDHLCHVHAKNGAWVRTDGRWEFQWLPMREGVADWRQVVADLRSVGYDGFISYEDFSEKPVREKLADDISFARELLASVSS